MKKWLRRIRGALGMGLAWAAGWSGVFFILALVGVFGTLGLRDYVDFAVLFGIVGIVGGLFGMVGFVGGAAFSVVLGITEGRRRFDELSLRRFAFWGAVGGLLVSMAFAWVAGATLADALGVGVVMTLTGAGSAAGSLALARRADDRELLEAADIADVELTEEETQQLLGGMG